MENMRKKLVKSLISTITVIFLTTSTALPCTNLRPESAVTSQKIVGAMRAELNGITPEKAMYELKKSEAFRMVIDGMNNALNSVAGYADLNFDDEAATGEIKDVRKEIMKKISNFVEATKEYAKLRRHFHGFISTSIGIPVSLIRAFPDDAVKEYKLADPENLKRFRRLIEGHHVMEEKCRELIKGLEVDIARLIDLNSARKKASPATALSGYDAEVEKELEIMAEGVGRLKTIIGWTDLSGEDFEKWFAHRLTKAALGNIYRCIISVHRDKQGEVFYQAISAAGVDRAQAEKASFVFTGNAFENAGLVAQYFAIKKGAKTAVILAEGQEYLEKVIEKINEVLPADNGILIIRQDAQALPAEIKEADNIVYFKTEQDGATWLEDFARQKQLPLQVKVLSQAILQAMGNIKQISDDLNSFKIAIETLKKQS